MFGGITDDSGNSLTGLVGKRKGKGNPHDWVEAELRCTRLTNYSC